MEPLRIFVVPFFYLLPSDTLMYIIQITISITSPKKDLQTPNQKKQKLKVFTCAGPCTFSFRRLSIKNF